MTTGCEAAPKPPDDPASCSLEAAPAAQPVGGDANGDGLVDVSDGASVARYLLAGGPAPVCPTGVDLVPDGEVNMGDIVAIWYSVGPKSVPYRPEVTAADCPLVERTADLPCGDGLAMGVEAPATVTGAEGTPTTATATVSVSSTDLPVEAWSFQLTADGCTLDSGTTGGTLAAEKDDTPPGLRQGGVAWQSVTGPVANVLTVLDWRHQTGLPIGSRQTVHSFTVSGTPTAGCAVCTLTLTAGDPASGVETVLSAEGWRYVPALGSATVEFCPG